MSISSPSTHSSISSVSPDDNRSPHSTDSSTLAGDINFLLKQYAPITVEEISTQAPLLKRVDRKYMVTSADTLRLLQYLSDTPTQMVEIDGKRFFHYISDYFDTPTFDLYHAAATKRRRRYKVRERFYCDSGDHFVEVKIRDGRGKNVKKRLRCAPVSPETVQILRTEGNTPHTFSFQDTDEGKWIAQILAEHNIVPRDYAVEAVNALLPCARTSYSRSTMLLPDGTRLTLDVNVQTSALSPEVQGDTCRPPYAQIPFVIIETKSSQRASAADKLLWSWGVRPIKISKYAFAIATHYGAKANKWARTLKRIDNAHSIQNGFLP